MKPISFTHDIAPAVRALIAAGHTPAHAVVTVLTRLAKEREDARQEESR